MERRHFLSSLLAYNALLLDARAQGTSRAPKLTIREVRAVRLRGMDYVRFVRVYTDQGLTGTGETADSVGVDTIINSHLGPSLTGRDPLDIEGILLDLWGYKKVPGAVEPVFMRGMGGPYLSAVSSVEMALWDLAGKALSVPIYRLMGGRVRDKVAVYFHARDPKRAKAMADRTGVKGIKIGIDYVTERGAPAKGWDPKKIWNFSVNNADIEDIVRHVASFREALGKQYDIMVEAHARYDIESAIQIAKALEPYRPMFLEEPIPSDNPDAMARVRSDTRIPIAAGENIYTRYGYRPFLEKQALSVIQPDMSKCGGLLEARKIAAMAEVYHVPIAPHGTNTNLGKIAAAHVCATVPNFVVLEWLQRDGFDALTQPVEYNAGFVSVPDRPGIGIELNEDAVKERLEPGFKAL